MTVNDASLGESGSKLSKVAATSLVMGVTRGSSDAYIGMIKHRATPFRDACGSRFRSALLFRRPMHAGGGMPVSSISGPSPGWMSLQTSRHRRYRWIRCTAVAAIHLPAAMPGSRIPASEKYDETTALSGLHLMPPVYRCRFSDDLEVRRATCQPSQLLPG